MSSLLANIVGGIVSIDVDGLVLNNDGAHAGKRIDGWIDEWVGGLKMRVDGWMDRCLYVSMDRWIDVYI